MAELRQFTLNLLKRTRPYLNEAQSKIIAEDLINRVHSTVPEPGRELKENTPYIFGGKTASSTYRREEKSYSLYTGHKEIRSHCGSLTDSQKSKLVKKSELNGIYTDDYCSSRKRSLVHSCTPPHQKTNIRHSKVMLNSSNLSSARTQRRESVAQKIFQSDVSSGAPAIKKKRSTVVANENNAPSVESNVFERLYAARKKVETIPFVQKKTAWLNVTKPKILPKVSNKESMDVCVGSIQKALDSLNLKLK